MYSTSSNCKNYLPTRLLADNCTDLEIMSGVLASERKIYFLNQKVIEYRIKVPSVEKSGEHYCNRIRPKSYDRNKYRNNFLSPKIQPNSHGNC